MIDKHNTWHSRWQTIGQNWRSRLRRAGLIGVADSFEEALQPLAPLLTQLLWVAQPGFALFGEAEAIDMLVEYLEGEAEPNLGRSDEG